MPRVTDKLRDAQTLAEFSNLEPEGVEYFRNNFPDFAPREWWDYQYKNEKQWQLTQKLLRHSWENQFGDGIYNLMGLLGSVIAPSQVADAERAGEKALKKMLAEQTGEQTGEQAAKKMFAEWVVKNKNRFSEQSVKRMLSEDTDNEIAPPPYEVRFGHVPLQRAIVFLFENSWRARFCAECNKRFVAAEPKNKFCSETCSHENRNRQKREWFREYGKQWRRKVKKAKAKTDHGRRT